MQNETIVLAFIFLTAITAIFCIAAVVFVWQFQKRVLKHQNELLQAALQSQENEQRRLARELHDGLSMDIAAAKLQLFHVHQQLTQHNLDTVYYERTKNILEEVVTNTNNMAHSLMPATLERLGLVNALREMATAISTPVLQVQLTLTGKQVTVSDNNALLVYRIVQELVRNAIKHSGATVITIALQEQNDKQQITVTDNGTGIATVAGTGMGLRNIESRAKLLNAIFAIQNTGSGTTAVLIY